MKAPVAVRDAKPSARIAFAPLAPDLAARTNGLSAVADGRDAWLVLAPEDAFLSPDLQAALLSAATERPDVEIFYADDAAPRSRNTPLRLKPRWNPALLHAQDYAGVPLMVRGSAFHRLGGLAPEAGTAAAYDLLLRAEAQGVVIDAIHETLLAFPGERPAPSETDQRRALTRALKPGTGVLPGLVPHSLRVRALLAQPPATTLVVPTRQSRRQDGSAHVVRMLDSLTATRWPHDRLSVLLGDDVQDAAIYGDLSRYPFAVERMVTARAADQPFNYAAKMNALWRAASTEHLVLMNDDVEVVTPDWLEALSTFSSDEGVGGVGARLTYPDGSIQHAGMVGGLLGVFAHAWAGQPPDASTYGDWATVQRDWSAVTGAVFATRRRALEAVDGFDESFELEYNDVDLCLRMRAAGLRIVQAPDAALVHHEKASRGERTPPGSQTAAFLARWRDVIRDDPAYHPGLSRDGVVVRAEPVWGAWYSSLPTSEPGSPRQQ